MLTFDQIKELIDLVSERGLQGLEIERSGFRVKIDGKTAAVAPLVTEVQSARSQPLAAQAAAAETPSVGAEQAPEAEPETDELDGLHLVESPIVGTFYTSPSPDADPYVLPGDRVKKGQVLCIVEAMKLMNEIESDEDGVIEKVLPKNAQPIEFGEPLFAIRLD